MNDIFILQQHVRLFNCDKPTTDLVRPFAADYFVILRNLPDHIAESAYLPEQSPDICAPEIAVLYLS